MKRFFIFISLLFLLGCSVYKRSAVYQKSYTYDQRDVAFREAYWWADSYKADSIPMDEWLTYQKYIDDGYSIEKVYQKKWDEDTEIVISLTTLVSDSTTYHLLVLKRTKNKSLW